MPKFPIALLSHELITSKIFKGVMMIVIIINTILMLLPIFLESECGESCAANARMMLSILENIVGMFLVVS